MKTLSLGKSLDSGKENLKSSRKNFSKESIAKFGPILIAWGTSC